MVKQKYIVILSGNSSKMTRDYLMMALIEIKEMEE
jgi:hypothetical protein